MNDTGWAVWAEAGIGNADEKWIVAATSSDSQAEFLVISPSPMLPPRASSDQSYTGLAKSQSGITVSRYGENAWDSLRCSHDCNHPLGCARSFRIEEKPMQEFQGQYRVELSGIVPVSLEVVPHYGLEPPPFEVGTAKGARVEQHFTHVPGEGVPVPD